MTKTKIDTSKLRSCCTEAREQYAERNGTDPWIEGMKVAIEAIERLGPFPVSLRAAPSVIDEFERRYARTRETMPAASATMISAMDGLRVEADPGLSPSVLKVRWSDGSETTETLGGPSQAGSDGQTTDKRGEPQT